VLVKWSHMEPVLATWEDKEAIKQQFSAAPAWGQAWFQDSGDVSSSLEPAGRQCRVRTQSVKLCGSEWAL
jgi:hypothetical protein